MSDAERDIDWGLYGGAACLSSWVFWAAGSLFIKALISMVGEERRRAGLDNGQVAFVAHPISFFIPCDRCCYPAPLSCDMDTSLLRRKLEIGTRSGWAGPESRTRIAQRYVY